jgi:predicted nucleic acid-binding protein
VIVADTSVLVPAVVSSHPDHHTCHESAGLVDGAVAHTLVELYSVLTRLPQPHTVAPSLAARAVRAYARRVIQLDPADLAHAIVACSQAGVSGGATYDAMIGIVAARHDAVLLTRDERAARTYERVGADIRWVST